MSQGTTFQAPLRQGGPDTGVPSTTSIVNVPFLREVVVSAGARDATITLPDNSFLYESINFVTTKVSGIAQGARILLGDGTTDSLYGTTSAVSAAGTYTATLNLSSVSAKTVVVKVTASVAASAADLADVSVNVLIVGGIRG